MGWLGLEGGGRREVYIIMPEHWDGVGWVF
jgi:hypothetical protein